MKVALDVDGVIIDFVKAMGEVVFSGQKPLKVTEYFFAQEWFMTDNEFKMYAKQAIDLTVQNIDSYLLATPDDFKAMRQFALIPGNELWCLTNRRHDLIPEWLIEAPPWEGLMCNNYDKQASCDRLSIDYLLDDHVLNLRPNDWLIASTYQGDHPFMASSITDFFRKIGTQNG